jgi:HEAT repeat protein
MRTYELKPAVIAILRLTLNLQWALAIAVLFACAPLIVPAQQQPQDRSFAASQLTPQQLEIAKQQLRLNSSATEERRDAVMRLGSMKHPESSRVAATALRDSSAIVRATATRAILWLGQGESAALLLPLLQDRDEFVRQETAYALGETHSRTAVFSLVVILGKEKIDGVRGAAVVALGQIGDEMAVIPLAELLGRRVAASGIINRVRRSKRDENEFVRRAAAHSLGQIRNRAAVPALSALVIDERAPDDVRREAANSLGLIGDPSAIPALRAVLSARDPYLSRIASEALLKIAQIEVLPPTKKSINLP